MLVSQHLRGERAGAVPMRSVTRGNPLSGQNLEH